MKHLKTFFNVLKLVANKIKKTAIQFDTFMAPYGNAAARAINGPGKQR